MCCSAVEEPVDGFGAVAAGGHLRSERRAASRELAAVRVVAVRLARERASLVEVRGDDSRQREEPSPKRLDRVVLEELGARAAAITGSRTSGTGFSSRKEATVSMIGREKSIPVLAASTPMSKNASSCARMKSGGSS